MEVREISVRQQVRLQFLLVKGEELERQLGHFARGSARGSVSKQREALRWPSPQVAAQSAGGNVISCRRPEERLAPANSIH